MKQSNGNLQLISIPSEYSKYKLICDSTFIFPVQQIYCVLNGDNVIRFNQL